jgi:chromosome segregation ATPase
MRWIGSIPWAICSAKHWAWNPGSRASSQDKLPLWNAWAASNGACTVLKRQTEEIGELRQENEDQMITFRRQAERVLEQNTEIRQLEKDNRWYLDSVSRQTDLLLNLGKAYKSLYRSDERWLEEKEEYRKTIREQEGMIEGLEAEVKRLRKEIAALASTSAAPALSNGREANDK